MSIANLLYPNFYDLYCNTIQSSTDVEKTIINAFYTNNVTSYGAANILYRKFQNIVYFQLDNTISFTATGNVVYLQPTPGSAFNISDFARPQTDLLYYPIIINYNSVDEVAYLFFDFQATVITIYIKRVDGDTFTGDTLTITPIAVSWISEAN